MKKETKTKDIDELVDIVFRQLRYLEKVLFPYFDTIPYKTIYSYFGRRFHLKKRETRKILIELKRMNLIVMGKRGIRLTI